MSVDQFVDPQVSRAKFDREVDIFLLLEDDYRRRGWILQRVAFPLINVMMAAPQLRPPAVVIGVEFDYSNFDAMPPSVVLVNPFSFEPYRAKDLPTLLNRQPASPMPPPDVVLPGMNAQMQVLISQPLMQMYGPDDVPFLCIPGVREYHEHPGHTGDPWELHRASNEGRLVHLLDVIHRYGVAPISQYNVALLPQVTGFGVSHVPA